MRYLGEQLARAGFTVHGVRLPGHGRASRTSTRPPGTDWADAVEDAFDDDARCAAAGRGGRAVARRPARAPPREPPRRGRAVASLAAPLWLEGLSAGSRDWAAGGALATRRFARCRSSAAPTSRDPRMKAANPGYAAIPMRALGAARAVHARRRRRARRDHAAGARRCTPRRTTPRRSRARRDREAHAGRALRASCRAAIT